MNKQEIYDLISTSAQDFFDVFGGSAVLAAHWQEDDWSGSMAAAHRFPDGTIAIMTDYFGSCSYCCQWQGAAEDGEVLELIQACVRNARVFDSEGAARAYLSGPAAEDAMEFSHRDAVNLLNEEWK